jgi:hypothetical protein
MWDSFGTDNSIAGPSSFTGKKIPGFGLGTIGEQGGNQMFPLGAAFGILGPLGGAALGASGTATGAKLALQGVREKNNAGYYLNAINNFTAGQQQLGQNWLASAQFSSPVGYTTAPEAEFNRQKRGSLFQADVLNPKEDVRQKEIARFNRDFQLEPETRALARLQNKEELDNKLREYHGKLSGMFGRISPIDSRSLVV